MPRISNSPNSSATFALSFATFAFSPAQGSSCTTRAFVRTCNITLRPHTLIRMKPIDRRRFLALSAATAVSLKSLAQTPAATTLTLHPETHGPTIPSNFVGLSYETQQLTDPAFFSTANTGLIAMFRALAPHGVLRLGGNTSDVGWWKPTPTSPQPPLPPKVVIIPLRPEETPFQKLAYSVTPEAIRNLRAFLDATGWTCLYGINLGTSTPERAAEEAAYVAKTLGPRLEYFQLGNEPDIFYNRFRVKATWTADAYFDEWLASANAIRAAVSTAKFGLPDTSGNPTWYAKVADRLGALPAADRPKIAALSHHYYFGGPPSNPNITLDKLLQPNAKVKGLADNITAASTNLSTKVGYKVPYRMTEGNTCYRGGKPGVSDVFGAALWAADYLLTLASLGYSGVNLHGGSGKAVADSLGGTLPGELLMPDPKAPHPRPFYTPIAEVEGKYVAEPVFYGMLFAQKFAGATIVPIDFDPGPIDATAFAAKLPDGKFVLGVINKDEHAELRMTVKNHKGACGQHLTANSLTSHDVNFANFNELNRSLNLSAADEAKLKRGGKVQLKGKSSMDNDYVCQGIDHGWVTLQIPAASAIFYDLI